MITIYKTLKEFLIKINPLECNTICTNYDNSYDKLVTFFIEKGELRGIFISPKKYHLPIMFSGRVTIADIKQYDPRLSELITSFIDKKHFIL